MVAGAIVQQGDVQGENVNRGKLPILPSLTNHFPIFNNESWAEEIRFSQPDCWSLFNFCLIYITQKRCGANRAGGKSPWMQTHFGVGESSKGRIDHGANRLWCESSNGRIDQGANRPTLRNVQWAKRPVTIVRMNMVPNCFAVWTFETKWLPTKKALARGSCTKRIRLGLSMFDEWMRALIVFASEKDELATIHTVNIIDSFASLNGRHKPPLLNLLYV